MGEAEAPGEAEYDVDGRRGIRARESAIVPPTRIATALLSGILLIGLPLIGLPLIERGAPTQAAEKPLAERVNVAIDRGVAWMKKEQHGQGGFGRISADGNYEGGATYHQYPVGPTALGLLTMLKCGVPPDDPAITKGFDFITEVDRLPRSTYERAVLILAIEARTNQVKRERKREEVAKLRAAPGAAVDLTVKLPRKDLAWMKELVKALLAEMRKGGWRYGMNAPDPGSKWDMSNTQMALLALHSADRCGVKVPTKSVAQAIELALRTQDPDGPQRARSAAAPGSTQTADRARGWSYVRKSQNELELDSTGTMTTGGLVVLLTGRDILARHAPKRLEPLEDRIQTGVQDGLAWLDLHWTVEMNAPDHLNYHLMYLYGLERVGDLQRVHLIGSHDWYTEGAEWLVKHQKEDGHWEGNGYTHEPKNVIDTCFALLFLDRATLAVTTPR